MSSSHTIRQMIIDENLPLLVKSLTGFKEDDENFKLCESYAFSRIACNRFLSVNSHELMRRIDGVAERFMAENYTKHGEKLKELVQEFVADPLCTNHYELDVQWSIIQFLLGVSKNIIKNKKNIQIADFSADDDRPHDRRQSTAMNELVRSLIQHNIPTIQDRTTESGSKADDSDLSVSFASAKTEYQRMSNDWSDDEGEGAICDVTIDDRNDSLKIDAQPLRLKLIPFGRDVLKPPEKKPIFTEFNCSKATEWREKNVQHSWWNATNPNELSIISEWCLLREIIWTLQLQPINSDLSSETVKKCSKCFSLDVTADEVVVNSDVSLVSTTEESLRSFLSEFARIATKLYRFRKFFVSVFHPPAVNSFLESAQIAPYSIQCYATGLKDFLQIISKVICDLEIELIEQDLTKTHTIVYLYTKLLPHFRKVNMLYDIHNKVYIDFKTNAGHVCVAYLFASLIHEMDTTALVERLNIAASLFLVSIRFYLSVFNNWWIEGRFKDWCSEFLIENVSSQNRISNTSSLIYQRRSISAGVSRSLDVARIKERIDRCKIVNLFRNESLEAGYILNILYNLDKMMEMKKAERESGNASFDIGKSFMSSFWEEIEKFRIENPTQNQASNNENTESSAEENPPEEPNEDIHNQCEELNEMDALLSIAFNRCTIRESKNMNQLSNSLPDQSLINSYQIYESLYRISHFTLPLSIVIHDRLRAILKSRIFTANKYVQRIFVDEYKIMDHFVNLQRVFFFGAGDLMLTFYSKLFMSMNSAEDWNNAYHLTVQLNDVLTTRYPGMDSMFSVEITAADSHIKDTLTSLNDISINYAVSESIRDVIHDQALMKYNQIFRFLLQIKWAIWTLETLRFPVAFKKRTSYEPLTLIDLIFKRLALVRNWIIYSVQCIHSHLMTFVIQSMGQQLTKRILKTECLREIIELHDSYIDTIYQHCFRKTSDIALKTGIEQLLSLVIILRDEWMNLDNVNSHGDFVDGENEFDVSGTVQQVDIIEATYINCHCKIAEILTSAVFKRDETTLASLCAAFNCSCPY